MSADPIDFNDAPTQPVGISDDDIGRLSDAMRGRPDLLVWTMLQAVTETARFVMPATLTKAQHADVLRSVGAALIEKANALSPPSRSN